MALSLLAASMSMWSAKEIHARRPYRPLLATWLLELILSLGWYKKSNNRYRKWIIEDEEFSQITGIKVTVDEKPRTNDVNAAQLIFDGKSTKYTDATLARNLKTNLAIFRKQPLRDDLCLFKNINLIGHVLGLNQAEKAILCFVSVLNVFHAFKDAISSVSHKVSLHETGIIIAHLTGQNEADVLVGLRQDSALRASGIIEVNRHQDDLEDALLAAMV
jgi:hypothetical protein